MTSMAPNRLSLPQNGGTPNISKHSQLNGENHDGSRDRMGPQTDPLQDDFGFFYPLMFPIRPIQNWATKMIETWHKHGINGHLLGVI